MNIVVAVIIADKFLPVNDYKQKTANANIFYATAVLMQNIQLYRDNRLIAAPFAF